MTRFAEVDSLLDEQTRRRTVTDLDGIDEDPAGVWRGWFDGAIKQQRDKAAGWWVLAPDGREFEGCLRTGVGTSNQAEYEALICCLKELHARGARRVVVRGDSQLVVYQTMGRWQLKQQTLAPFRNKVWLLSAQFESIKLVWVPREQNRRADAMSNKPFQRIKESR